MNSLTRWFVETVAIPLLAALWLLIDRWGKQNTLYILILPLLFAAWRLLARSRDRPRCRELGGYQPFKDAVGSWELLDAFGLAFLALFEASSGLIAESQELEHVPYVFLISFVPYLALSWWARRSLLYANELIARFRESSPISDNSLPT